MKTLESIELPTSNLVKPTRILVATDLSDGERLIPHAIAQAKAAGAGITLLYAILPAETMPLDAGSIAYVDWENRSAISKARLSKWRAWSKPRAFPAVRWSRTVSRQTRWRARSKPPMPIA